ncbi:MAG: hypothetical protein FJY81_05720, partial [Candidatus Aminicenantes bacterium]|nr:hypothetical protein [Candidatus Aminicenantes bacterium]
MEIFNWRGRRPREERRTGEGEIDPEWEGSTALISQEEERGGRPGGGKGATAKTCSKPGNDGGKKKPAWKREEGEGVARLTTEGLVTIFIPRATDIGLSDQLELFISAKDAEHKRGSVSDGQSLAGADFVLGAVHPDSFYLGCEFSNFKKVMELARTHALPVVWANPLKFIESPERLILLRAIAGKIPFPPERQRLADKMPLFGPDQEALAFKKFGPAAKEAFERTFEVAEKCRFTFEDIVTPLPADIFPMTLRGLVLGRLRSARNLSWRERQRARRELEVIEKSGFAAYFLIVHDVVEFARRRGILHNLKGSGASSFLAYLLGISHVNPVEFDLYFERFLNSGRNDPPDIDLDFDSRKRDEVLAYVLQKYGQGEKTGGAFVCSLKNYRARSALYETARAFGLPPEEARSLSKRIPFFADPDFLRRDKPAAGQLDIWKLASGLSGVYAEISLHVGGVILTPAPATRYLPLEQSAKGFVMSHFDRDAVEDLKLIKLDLLSVRGLAAISETRERLGIRSIPAGDAKTY